MLVELELKDKARKNPKTYIPIKNAKPSLKSIQREHVSTMEFFEELLRMKRLQKNSYNCSALEKVINR